MMASIRYIGLVTQVSRSVRPRCCALGEGADTCMRIMHTSVEQLRRIQVQRRWSRATYRNLQEASVEDSHWWASTYAAKQSLDGRVGRACC
jgi:hypothetical protein